MIKASQKIKDKLEIKHRVSWDEVIQAFGNRNVDAGYLKENRPIHQSNPPSFWFIAETNSGRLLKIVFIKSEDVYYIRTAFEPTGAQTIRYLDGTDLCSVHDLSL